jgi:hypothetical protein
MRQFLFFLFWVGGFTLSAQTISDTLPGYVRTIGGEQLAYFSPLRQFAPQSLLTRCNGKSPIQWEGTAYRGKKPFITYEFLVGHSTGTSSGIRNFTFSLNGDSLFTFSTQPKLKGNYRISGVGKNGCQFEFVSKEFDLNQDGFGWLYVTVPSSLGQEKPQFSLVGQDQNSRDWMMVFTYFRELKMEVQVTGLVTNATKKRLVNVWVDWPESAPKVVTLTSAQLQQKITLKPGYNAIQAEAYSPEFAGKETFNLKISNQQTLSTASEIKPIRAFEFHLIHHSHNDIGYSHVQPEVAKIQSNNIRMALQWKPSGNQQPRWHVESLWGIEQFLKTATPKEKAALVAAIKAGRIVLTANYANVLTGLCQTEEQRWNLRYGQKLEVLWGIKIKSAMITDIPGITHSALKAYTDAGISYLSLGPNYVGNLPDRGDRVGSVIDSTGDRPFYWKPHANSPQKLLVWTAGKGYSYFHNVPERTKQQEWEKRISNYVEELTAQNYPYDLVQLRYTKNADNGPVDTNLTAFAARWNQKFLYPKLLVTDVPTLFSAFEKKYGDQIPAKRGEITPYWEDGALSTVAEEIQARKLAREVIWLTQDPSEEKLRIGELERKIDQITKYLVLFHEHTWGSWCSISDPDLPFTTQQWAIKKSYLDSAQAIMDRLMEQYPVSESVAEMRSYQEEIKRFVWDVDSTTGGLRSIRIGRKTIFSTNQTEPLFGLIYRKGINPIQTVFPKVVRLKSSTGFGSNRLMVSLEMEGMEYGTITYEYHHESQRLTMEYHLKKKEILTKESLHIALPLEWNRLNYANGVEPLAYGSERQLAGSNREFVCVEKEVLLDRTDGKLRIQCWDLPLLEVGGMMDENTVNGAKVWKRDGAKPGSSLYWYVLNNYWHTNYKAAQTGDLHFWMAVDWAE